MIKKSELKNILVKVAALREAKKQASVKTASIRELAMKKIDAKTLADEDEGNGKKKKEKEGMGIAAKLGVGAGLVGAGVLGAKYGPDLIAKLKDLFVSRKNNTVSGENAASIAKGSANAKSTFMRAITPYAEEVEKNSKALLNLNKNKSRQAHMAYELFYRDKGKVPAAFNSGDISKDKAKILDLMSRFDHRARELEDAIKANQ